LEIWIAVSVYVLVAIIRKRLGLEMLFDPKVLAQMPTPAVARLIHRLAPDSILRYDGKIR